MNIVSLNGEWKFHREGEEKSYPVSIPGSVLSGLLSNNLIEDPFYKDNEYPTREILKDNYIFTKTFEYKDNGDSIKELVMEGIDTIAMIFINDIPVASCSNAHRTYCVNVGDALKDGTNVIKAVFTSAITYMGAHVPAKGKEIHYTACGAMTGNQYIRKPHSSFGWDWGPQLPDIGIWRDIYIRTYREAVLDSFYVREYFNNDYTTVDLKITGDIRCADTGFISPKDAESRGYKLVATIIGPDGETVIKNALCDKKIRINKPKLWWPNGLGEQALYKVIVSLRDSKLNTLSEREEYIGIRTITVSTAKDEWGREFAFKVNGHKIFAKGADYIPEDCVYSRITDEVLARLINDSKEANFNMLRVWGGGYYPSNKFYELADRAGIIIWQDFMFACNVFELDDEFRDEIVNEARDNVRRIRNHASLGLWCGNNEIESAFDHWGGFKDHSRALKNDYLEIFEKILPSIVKELDPKTFYWPSSPSSYGSFKNPDDDNVGDRHYWDVWHGEKPFTDYENYYFRFCSEFGFQSWPEIATIKTFAEERDLNIFSKVMESHQKNGTANAKILHYIAENFLYPKDFESLLYISQVLQGMAIKYGVEHWRRNRGRCMGALYWQLNDNWPVASWSSIDYTGRWKGLQYMARHFYAPVLGSLAISGRVYTPYVQNETWKKKQTRVNFFVKDMHNTVIYEDYEEIETPGMGVASGKPIDISDWVCNREDECYVEAVFTHSDGTVSHQVEPVLKYKHMNLPDTKVNITTILKDKHTIEAHLQSDNFAAFVALMCDEVNIKWDDNFFFLTGNEVVLVGHTDKPIALLPRIYTKNVSESYEFNRR